MRNIHDTLKVLVNNKCININLHFEMQLSELLLKKLLKKSEVLNTIPPTRIKNTTAL